MSEWNAFLNSEPRTPPRLIHEQVRSIVERDLNPRTTVVAAKVAALHLAGALLSLVLCPQFGVGPFGGDAGLMAFLRQWGWMACAAGCGTVFMAGTGVLSGLLLSPDERRVLGRNQTWIFSSLVGLSWAAFMIAAGQSEHAAHHEFSPSAAWNLVWMVAGIGSALAAFRVTAPRPTSRLASNLL